MGEITWKLEGIFFYLSKRITGQDGRKFLKERVKKALKINIEKLMNSAF